MANWDNYTQKSTPEDADTLMIKDTAGGANKRTPFSGVWNWIVKKLASAVISQLETTNKSIIPAINELNSKTGKFIRDKQEFDACAAGMTGGIAVYINSMTMSELTGTKFKLSSKGVISNDGLNTDFILSVGPGDTIITGRIVDGEMISLYQYKGTVVS